MPAASSAPRSISEALADWPVRDAYTPSPADWRDEVFYFLLPDRFSNGEETEEHLLDVDLSTPAGLAKIQELRGPNWDWSQWTKSGGSRFQGGTLKGITGKLQYLQGLGVTTLWVGPVFRQRVELDTYHGYGIQDFLEIDPRFGTKADLVELVDKAHQGKMKVILDVIFNHSGCNWLYDASAGDVRQPPYKAVGWYDPIHPRNGFGESILDPAQTLQHDDFVWPAELQDRANYVGAGSGSLGAGSIDDPEAEFRRTDFCDLRKFNLNRPETIATLVTAYQYWIAFADIDGFRIDTFKHVSQEQARTFCNCIKEYAQDLGKEDFFLVAEIAGGDSVEDHYLDISGRNLNACLDIGEQRDTIVRVGKGMASGSDFFSGFAFAEGMGSHRNWGSRHLSIANDHDHVFGDKIRLAADASNDHQGVVPSAIQLFTLGIPCLYYGTEQGLASGAEADQRQWLSGWKSSDTYLREAMFGPEHPLASGWKGTQREVDAALPGFGPHGTTGHHVFNPNHPIYLRIAQLAKIRQTYKALRKGRQYPREISFLGNPFGLPGTGELIAWSRLFDDQEILVVVNPHGTQGRSGKVIVDGGLSRAGLRVVANTDPAAGPLAVGARLGVQTFDGWSFVDLTVGLIGPSEVLVLVNDSAWESGHRS